MLWLLVALLAYGAICLAMSYIYYDIIQGFVSACVAIPIRKVLGYSMLGY
jgi:hypothetical protein